MSCNIEVVESDLAAGHLAPGRQSGADRLDRGQRIDLELDIDLAPR